MFVETVQVASLETYLIDPDWSQTRWVPYDQVHITKHDVRAHYNELRGAYSWTFTTARCMGQVAGRV